MNFIDTSPFYGRGMSEVLLGVALRGVPRDSYLLGTKLGRYFRDVTTYRQHISSQQLDFAVRNAALYLGANSAWVR